MADDGTLPRVERRGRDRGRRRVLRHARWLVQGGGREDWQGPVAVQSRIGRGGEPDHVHGPRRQAVRGRLRRDRQSAAEGERTFGVMNCDGCHGGGAVGWVGPSLRDGRWRYGGADGDIFQSIYYGQPHGMPAYGGLLPPTAIWKLVTYLQSLEPPANVPTESWR